MMKLFKNIIENIFVACLLLAFFCVAGSSHAEDITLEISAEAEKNGEQELPVPLPDNIPPSAEEQPNIGDVPPPLAQAENNEEPLVGPLSPDQQQPLADAVTDEAGQGGIPPQDVNPEQVNNNQVPEPKEQKLFDGTDFFENNSFIKSVLFNEQELEILYSSINSHRESGVINPKVKELINKIAKKDDDSEVNGAMPVQQSLDDLASIPNDPNDPRTQIKEFVVQTFYLKSLLLPEDDMWTIWFNDSKVRSSENKIIPGYDGLKIEKVKKQSVTFTYTEPNLDLIYPKYKEELIKNKSVKWDLRSKDGKILVSSLNKKIKFTIGLGQTFVVADLKVHEGFVEPSTVQNPYYIDPAMQSGGAMPSVE